MIELRRMPNKNKLENSSSMISDYFGDVNKMVELDNEDYRLVIMDPIIRKKLDEYKKLVTEHGEKTTSKKTRSSRPDSLSQVIRSKKDADDSMADLESVIRRYNKPV